MNNLINVIDFYTVDLCKEYPDHIFVFGDNLIRKGKGGQAIIRSEPNAYGIPTKRLPGMDECSFFGDRPDEEIAVRLALLELDELCESYKIVFPKNGLGTGLAKMKENSPELYEYLKTELLFRYGFDNETGRVNG